MGWGLLAGLGSGLEQTGKSLFAYELDRAKEERLQAIRAKERAEDRQARKEDMAEVHSQAKEMWDIKSKFTKEEREAGQKFTSSERVAGQEWKAGENESDRQSAEDIATYKGSYTNKTVLADTLGELTDLIQNDPFETDESRQIALDKAINIVNFLTKDMPKAVTAPTAEQIQGFQDGIGTEADWKEAFPGFDIPERKPVQDDTSASVVEPTPKDSSIGLLNDSSSAKTSDMYAGMSSDTLISEFLKLKRTRKPDDIDPRLAQAVLPYLTDPRDQKYARSIIG